MTQDLLASRVFGPGDQQRFSTLTGDCNPVHMDPVAARRTQAGAPVVHGVHALLWMLDSIGVHYAGLSSIARLNARFLKVIYLGDLADIVVTKRDADALTAEVTAGGNVALRLSVTFGPAERASVAAHWDGRPAALQPASALDLTIELMASMRGHVAFAQPIEEIAGAFPAAHKWLGARRVAALGASTRLVGMICPGLHSLYAGLSLAMCDDASEAPELAFEVTNAHSRLRLVRQSIAGGGLFGTVESFVRPTPVAQASIAAIDRLIDSNEFTDSVALIIGGSRGLGEVTAKLVAAGGGRVIITYASGISEAEHVAAEIIAWGGHAHILRYDVRQPPEPQLRDLPTRPTHLYYFATPPIARRKNGPFDRSRFDEFITYYVEGFYTLCRALSRSGATLSVYYPSSVYVEKWPGDLVEYAMAKAAGELLCTNIGADLKNVRVTATRLPPLATDQTATLLQSKTADPATVMLPVIRTVQRL